MTVEKLYKWAIKNNCEDYNIEVWDDGWSEWESPTIDRNDARGIIYIKA